jgi:diguanylate cyclase (GGDEF)-like protein
MDKFIMEYAFTIVNFILVLCLIFTIAIAIKLIFLYIEKNRLETEIIKGSVEELLKTNEKEFKIVKKNGEKLSNQESEEILRDYIYNSGLVERSKPTKNINPYNLFQKFIIDLKRNSEIDKMTGLKGRENFKKAVKETGSLMYCNINGLRKINKEMGYEEGDNQIIKVVLVLKDSAPQEAVICRISGDEFAIDLPNFGQKESEELLKTINDIFEKREDIYIDLAIGIAYKDDLKGKDLDEIITRAEEDMYKNKLISKNSVRGQLIYTLLDALGEKSFETEEHALRLRDYSFEIGKRMNLPQTEMNDLVLLAYLHDIGKMSIPDSILTKNTKLSNQEWETMKKHPEFGADFVKRIPDLKSSADGILSHHENWDGTGYPKGISGEDIPLVARIIRVVDSYDAMTNTRSYNIVKTGREALEEIKKYSGTQYDPEIVDVFIQIINEENKARIEKEIKEKKVVVNLF